MTICLLLVVFSHLLQVFFTRANIISAEDPSIFVFPSLNSQYTNQLNYVENILVDTIYNRTYVGGVNKVFSFSMDLKTVHKVLELMPDKCDSLEPDCNTNFIKLLQFDLENRLYVCGTNNKDPKCWRYRRDSLEAIKNLEMYGTNRSPRTKDGRAITLFYRSSVFTAMDSIVRKLRPVIAPPEGTILKDFQESSSGMKMLTDPTFVSAHEFGTDYVYIFFHEVSKETKIRKVQHSRVARICYNDIGIPIFQSTFITFMKAHLVCKKQTSTKEYYYDELESTYVVNTRTSDGDEVFIYGVFSMTSEYGGSSAICRYRLKDIDDVMNTSPLNKEQADGSFLKTPFSAERSKISRRKCSETVDGAAYSKVVFESFTDVLLYDDILSYDAEPLFTSSGRLKSLVVDDFHLKSNMSDAVTHLIFTGSFDGKVYKIMIGSQKNMMGRIVEILKPFQTYDPIYILKKNQDLIYAGGGNGVATLNVQRCSSYRLCNDCLKLRDPYCAWSRSKGECFHVKSLEESDLIQDTISGSDNECPTVNYDFGCTVSISLADISQYAYLLSCNVYSKSPVSPIIISWLLDNKQVYTGNTHELMGNKKNLLIKKLNEETSGKYECIVESRESRKKCNVTIQAPTKDTTTTLTPRVTEIDTSTSPIKILINYTEKESIFTVAPRPTGIPVEDIKNSSPYKTPFIILLVICICLIILIFILLLCVRSLRQILAAVTEVDGETTSNGHHKNARLKFSFSTNDYKLNRKDSTKKELLKQKSKSRVYKPTTIEMTEEINDGAEAV